ncbi:MULTISPECIES: endopeptidase La [unclassified Gemella]|uniref:endopeptidase La n=1 Tax=unclassified Gemella TaxID=2624949 RepID=UPI001C04692D|nr:MULTISPECIES: endopeptidase La [unclassified Gemella]MBU0278318.1 endopeptidase La [Gemella sp. zg-1178]QWQ38177.1 endopeptidase La [Gemella sp. zg-570]
MTKYYLLEHKELFIPDNIYNIEIKDKYFLSTIKNIKNKQFRIFVTINRKPMDSFNGDKDLDIYDENGFNKFYGTYGSLKYAKDSKLYTYICEGVADVLSGVYKDDRVEHLEIAQKNTTNINFDQEKKLKVLKKIFKEFLTLERLDLGIFNIKNLEKFINKNLKFFPLDILMMRRVVFTTDLEKKTDIIIKSIENITSASTYKRDIDNKVRINIDNQQKEYFLREQMKVVQDELKELSPDEDDIELLRKKILELKLNKNDEDTLLKELNRLEKTPAIAPENSIIRSYLETIISLPWNKETVDRIDIKESEKILNEYHYGLEKIKERILEFLAVKKLRNDMKSPILCLVGPPGVGKSSLAKSVAKAMDRNFIRLSLGGVRDEAEIRGHRRTYVGAMPGKLIQSLKKVKTKNPVILLDEIDKMASDIKGDPASAMLEVIDPDQNYEFADHYLDIPFDLSKVLFIATANNLSLIPAPLRDRMEVIELESYTIKEKENIATKYLIKNQILENGLTANQIKFSKQAILKIINGYTYEAGVRNLNRLIGKVCRKAALRILKGEEKIKIGLATIEEFLGYARYDLKEKNSKPEVGIVNGLAYTTVGGDTLEIETSISKGNGKIILTGKLGDVMKESAQTAISYLRSHSKELEFDNIDFNKIDIHLHVPEGAIPKDGPSAGIAITTSLYSTLTNKRVNNDIAMTGEITLHGKVLPIGGVKEKVLSSEKMGINTIILPFKNKGDLSDIPSEIKENLNIYFVKNISEVFEIVFKKEIRC